MLWSKLDRRAHAPAGGFKFGGYRDIRRHPPFRKGVEELEMIRKSVDRFSGNNMYRQGDAIMTRCGLHRIVI
jgi:hypothetical protein